MAARAGSDRGPRADSTLDSSLLAVSWRFLGGSSRLVNNTTLDQPPVSAHIPVSPQCHHITRSLMLRQLSLLTSHQMMSLSHWLPVCQIPRVSRRQRKPQPRPWIRILQPSRGHLHPQLLILMTPYSRRPNHPNTTKGRLTKHPGCRQLILCSVDFLLLFHYLSDCSSFVV